VGDLCVTGHRAAGRFRIAGDVPHHHGRRRSCCRPSPVQLASLGDACDRREAVGTTRAVRDLATGEISSVIGQSCRGQLRLTSGVALSATAVKEKWFSFFFQKC
jgi:hypothetical protein